jgi:pilus assembly protein TadC
MSDNVLMTWKIHMVKQNPGKGIAVLVFIITLSFFAGVAGESVIFFFLSLFILGIYVLPYFVPVTYTLTDASIIIKTGWMKKERAWREFRRWDQKEKAIKLYTMKNPSRLDNYRAWLLRTGQKADEVAAIVAEKIKNYE